MSVYECKICNYNTTNSGNFFNHKKTKKHCEKCKELQIKEDEQVLIKEKEIERLKKQLKEKENEKIILNKEVEKLQAINKIYEDQKINTLNNTQNNTLNNSNNSNNNNLNVGTLNYIVNKFPSAPPLQKITNFVINGIDTNDPSQHDKFISNVIYHHNHKTLHSLLGDHIISIYKNTDLSKQSFHTTDTSRLNYAVRIVDNIDNYYESESEDEIKMLDFDNNPNPNPNPNSNPNPNPNPDEIELFEIEKEYKKKLKEVQKQKELKEIIDKNPKLWVSDKNGYKICKMLINPAIKHMVLILKKKIKQKIKSKKNIDKDIINEIEFHQKISEIINNTDTKKLKNDINKYIAPIFNLSKKE